MEAQLQLKPEETTVIEFVPIDIINTHSQVRKIFVTGELQELADEIAVNGLINEPIVAKLDSKSFLMYKAFFEKLSEVKLKSPKIFTDETGKKWYYYLICGERRYRAQSILYYHGCTNCKNDLAPGETLRPGQCYFKHLKGTLIKIKSAINIDPFLAKRIQFSENMYVKPSFHEEADEYYKFYKCMRLIDPKMTMKKFSVEVGISFERLRRFLWFCELPKKIQDGVRSGTISPANALEIRRIISSDQIGDRLRDRMIEIEFQYLILLPSVSNKTYHERISNQLNNLMQISFFEEIGSKPLSRKQVRKIVGEKLVPGLMIQEAYIKQLSFLIKSGQVGKGRVYSGRSPSRQVRSILQQFEDLFSESGFKFTDEQKAILKGVNFEKAPTSKTAVSSK